MVRRDVIIRSISQRAMRVVYCAMRMLASLVFAKCTAAYYYILLLGGSKS